MLLCRVVGLIFNFMKILDPGSVVREGEFAVAARSRGLSDEIVALSQRVDDGQRLTPEQRENFINTAKDAFSGQLEATKPLIRQFTELETERNFRPGSVVPEETSALLETNVEAGAEREDGGADIVQASEITSIDQVNPGQRIDVGGQEVTVISVNPDGTVQIRTADGNLATAEIL